SSSGVRGDRPEQAQGGYASAPAARQTTAAADRKAAARARVESLLAELFRLQDLKADGVLDQEELIKVNEKISLLHYGKEGTDKVAIREKFRGIFREQLDPHGRPVPYAAFRDYMSQVLMDIDPSPDAQVMMLEQFIAEAESARAAFRFTSLNSESDAPFLAKLFETAPGSRAATSRPPQGLPVGYQPVVEHRPQMTMADRVARAEATAVEGFAKGDSLQVWSNSKGEWLDGTVLEVFPVDCQAEGYKVPAGSLKVSSSAGTTKWIMPGQ
ncbi:unnamed protein product, partial [Polarella glacialis]